MIETNLIKQRIDSLIEESFGRQKILFEAARYSLQSEGKRLRPLLTLLSATSFGASLEDAIDPALAIELIHTYSFIHDDLPCMDDDDLRRGKPSLHKVYGEAEAVLTGDYLLTFAFEVLAKAPLSGEKRLRLIDTLAKRAGAEGMIGGQVFDLLSIGHNLSEEDLTFMHEKKTGALISASLEFGGILGDAREEEMRALQELGHTLGLAYQIVDDILDATGSTETLGKPAGSDEEKNKPTSVTIYGIEKAKGIAKTLHMKALSLLESLNRDTGPIKELITKLLSRKF